MVGFVKQGFTVLAPDLLEVGDMGPITLRGDSHIDNTSFNTWYASMLIGRSIVGIQAGDVVRLVRLLHEDQMVKEVYGLAEKETAPILVHAAAFEPLIKRVALIEPYSSYRSIVMNRFYQPRFIFSAVPGALTAYDLPYLLGSIAPRKLLMVGTTDGNGKVTNPSEIGRDLELIKAAYKEQDQCGQFLVQAKRSEKIYQFFME